MVLLDGSLEERGRKECRVDSQHLAELHIRKLIHSLTGDSILLVINPGSGLLLINAAPEFHIRSETAAEQSNR